MRSPTLFSLSCALLLAPVALSVAASPLPDAVTGAGTLTVTAASSGRATLRAIPPSAALERFELRVPGGPTVAYAGLTEGEVGGVVFVDDKLVGTLPRAKAQAFYSCRGFTSATDHYWGEDGAAWAAELVRHAQPAATVTLVFSGKSTVQSIKSLVANPMLGQVKALVDMGTNPLSIVKTLNKAREDYHTREQEQSQLQSLVALQPGDAEHNLASLVPPEAVTFRPDGLVLAYPKYSIEFFVRDRTVQLIQQPAFHQLARQQAVLFYAPGTDWSRCNASSWTQAAPSVVAVPNKENATPERGGEK